MTNLIKTSARIFGGSSVAGMGFSFGRDIYRKAKKERGFLVAIFLIGLAFFGNYTGGIWIGRNYRTSVEAILKRVAAVLFIVPSFAILAVTVSLIQHLFDDDSPPPIDQIQQQSGELLSGQSTAPSIGEHGHEESFLTLIGIVVPVGIISIGYFAGNQQRRKRQQVWDAEEHNERFMETYGLIEHEDGTIEDISNGQNYRVDNVGKRRITLFPIGRRGKRAYITINETGKYDEFSGITRV